MSGFSGTLQGDYSNISAGGGGSNVNVWSGQGSGAFDLGWSGLKIQGDGGYTNYSVSGESINDWNIDGALIWQGMQGRLGATVGYNDLSVSGTSLHDTNYGGFGEWYAGHMFTVGVKGGGENISAGGTSLDADYVGGEAVFYVTPDVALNGDIDYLSISKISANVTSYGAMAEWLVSESTPISVYGGYTYSQLSSGGEHASTWTIGVKWYCNGNGASTLVDRQRSGNASWGVASPSIIDAIL
ncbi:MAG: hypothetical protein ABSC92_11735 [Rhizomicrobium sp.]